MEYRAALRIVEGQVSSEAVIEMKLIRENIDMTKDNLMTCSDNIAAILVTVFRGKCFVYILPHN